MLRYESNDGSPALEIFYAASDRAADRFVATGELEARWLETNAHNPAPPPAMHWRPTAGVADRGGLDLVSDAGKLLARAAWVPSWNSYAYRLDAASPTRPCATLQEGLKLVATHYKLVTP